MNIRSIPDTITRLTQMGDVTQYEPAGDTPGAERHHAASVPLTLEQRLAPDPKLLPCVAEVMTPKGPKPVMKSMITTACENNCYYCPFRAGRDEMRRESFTPDEMAAAFNKLERSGMVDGIFLSSGILKGGSAVQDKIIDTAEIIRRDYAYLGYVHLKIMPGVEYDQLKRAMQIADRVSINLEAPTPERLHALAPKKDFTGELLDALQWSARIRQELKSADPRRKVASAVTQFVVGAVGDTDLELLSLSHRLYEQIGLARAYYSGFNPIHNTPFEDLTPTDPQRERRLYQSSFLLRDYAWDVEDLPFVEAGNLRLDVDPKQAWADIHLLHAPVDIMHADREDLLRVPGIGPKGVTAILDARRQGRIRDLAGLSRLGVRGNRAAPYILINGRRPPQQLRLF